VNADAVAAAMTLYQLTEPLGPDELAEVAAPLAERLVPPDCLLSAFGIRPTRIGRGACHAEMTVRSAHLNQRGITQGGALIALADAAAGWASYAAAANGRFTTVSIAANLLRAAGPGEVLVARAAPVHLGRTTLVLQVSVVRAADDGARPKPLAQLTCTQLVLA
jgi:1,4-dihydroxy-2-naphthoyl-CoA hydrolase